MSWWIATRIKPLDEFKEVYRVSALCPHIPDDALRSFNGSNRRSGTALPCS